MVWSDQSAFYVCVEDLSNHTYSAWLGAVACGRYKGVYSRNQEMQSDKVEAAWGLCSIASCYPKEFEEILPEPNLLWRRMETSLLSSRSRFVPRDIQSKKRTGKPSLSWMNIEEIQEYSERLVASPILSDGLPDMFQRRWSSAEMKQSTKDTSEDRRPAAVGATQDSCLHCESGKVMSVCECPVAEFMTVSYTHLTLPTKRIV